MIYISVAFKEEAKPLLQQWQFQRDKRAPCTLYAARHIYLLITQMGPTNARHALETLLHYRPPKPGDCFINFGICAAPDSYALGTVLRCNHLTYHNQSLRLDAKTTCTLQMHDSPCNIVQPHAVDMESFILFQHALPHFSQCFCIKVVSDHFQPETVCKHTIAPLLQHGVATLKEIIHEYRHCDRS